ncbi:MAG: glutathione synthase [Gammaproteobacteria bacterium]|nr:MAG: glutathione synthase [Gammaproteobacteria bacterium]
MTIKLGVVMDPLQSVNLKKDTTVAMLQEVQARGWELFYYEQQDIVLTEGRVHGHSRRLTLKDNLQPDDKNWFELGESSLTPLAELDVILMRKDPPFDMEYIYTTYLLEQAESEGVLVVNRPGSLRDANEKLFTAWFPECTAPTLVARRKDDLRAFLDMQGDIILKPLDGMGGASIFRLSQQDPNVSVVIETLTHHGQRYVMAQRFLPEITEGDKRILVIDGEPVPYALARIPAAGETRGNLAAGGSGKGVALSDRDRWICEQVADTLRTKGLMFVGLDVIGDYLTEINVTSATCVRELDALYDLNISALLIDAIEKHLH